MPPLPQLRDRQSASVGFQQPDIAPSRALQKGIEDLAQVGDNYVAARDQKLEERDRIWAQGQITEARAADAEADSKRWASGEDLTGLPERVAKDFDADLANRRAAAPSTRAAKYLDMHAPTLKTDIVSGARISADKYLVTKNFTGLVDGVEKARGLVFNNPGSFAKTYAEQKTLIDGVQMPTELRAKMDAHLKELGSSAVQGMIENGNPYEAAKQLKSGAWNNFLDPDRLAGLTNAAQGEIKRREAEHKANVAQARAEASADAADLIQSDILGRQTLGQGVSVDDQARIRAGLTDKQWEKYQSAAQRADAVYALAGDLRTKSNAEIQSIIAGAKPKLNPDGSAPADLADQQAAIRAAQAIASNEITKRKADPASAVRDTFPKVAEAWQSVEQNNGDAGWMRVAIKRTMAAQEALGIPEDQRKPLPAGFAQSVAGDIRGAPADQAVKKLREYAVQFGANWKSVYAQLAPNLDANSAMAATLDDSNMAAVLLETSRIAAPGGKPGSGIEELKKSLGVPASGADSLSALIATDSDVRDLSAALARRRGGGAASLAVPKAVETLALGLMQRNGIDKTEATDKAIKALVRDKYNFANVNGVPFTAPKTVDIDAAERGARAIMGRLKGDGLDLPGADPGAITAETRDQYVSAIQRNGYWVTLPGNTGVELWAGDAPVTRNGQRIKSTWDVLTGVQPDAPPPGYKGK